MTADLYPTPTRLALLGDVAHQDPGGNGGVYREFWPEGQDAAGRVTAAGWRDVNGLTGRRVTAELAAMQRVGWVYLKERLWAAPDVLPGDRRPAGHAAPDRRRYWALGPAGLRVRAEAQRPVLPGTP